ncbi:polyunsaturated fatty acid 5-lipoxygenase-like isoform X2 [Hoplias malabaricus]|uniref:polyunsaturated fatty acid 5-lipoxygenase-like isoform X2 n=1 Tax=Hoplias malabaricus TaxID=27720 RepID=UPI003462BD4A
MPNYIVTVATGSQFYAGTNSYINLTLVGTEGCSKKILLDKYFYNDFEKGEVDSYDITVEQNLGEIELVKIIKEKYWTQDDWYCKYIALKTPAGDYIEFPCFRWIVDDKEVVLRNGQACLPQNEKSSTMRLHRGKELESKQKTYRWMELTPGFPKSIDAKTYEELPEEIQFECEKESHFKLNFIQATVNLGINQFMNMFQSSWSSLSDFEQIFWTIKNSASEYLMQNWKEDLNFGYQFLNGCNPVIIQKCTQIPEKFPVTHEMVAVSLERDLTLEEELKAGNIYLADYEILDGIPPNGTDPDTVQYLAAPMCLFYKNSKNKILPIAIQLSQTPGEESPIFLPSDDTNDWLLAKMWVKSSDFQVHQAISHLLRTHLISEVFGIAMYRQLSAAHPISKLLLPHVRFTVAINAKARDKLISEEGVFDKSLCFPESIKARGVEDLPNYFYRDDGNQVWDVVKRFVSEVVGIYYTSDKTVQKDEEIQAFVKDVCSSGMQDFDYCEFPKSLQTREQLIEYLTVVIFTASAQHAAINFGQFDWYSWIPNAPCTMRKPPPTKKGKVDMNFIMECLPDHGRSCLVLATVWTLSQFQENELFLGMYPDEHFIEKPVRVAQETFRKELSEVSKSIKNRNEGKHMQYCYLCPEKIPNSVAI